jgi:electron transport complex protein RnfC
MPPPEHVIIPLKQHVGSTCDPLVKKGAKLKLGSLIGESHVATIHASLSGKVAELNKAFPLHSGEKVPAVSIEGQGDDGPASEYMQGKQSMGKILFSGLVDGDRALMPVLEKIQKAQKHRVRTLIINGLEEFFIDGCKTALLREKATDIAQGITILQELTWAEEAHLAVYADALPYLEGLQEALPASVQLRPLSSKHPQYRDQLIVSSIKQQEYPVESSPEEIGICIMDAETAYGAARAVLHNEPFLDKCITIAGSGVDSPRNLRVRLGTSFREVLHFVGIDTEPIGKLIIGGPLSGMAVHSLDLPVTKDVGQLFVQSRGEVRAPQPVTCIKCGFCVQVCPMRLMPFLLSGFSEGGHFDLAEANDIFSCIECGCCAYVCPSNIPMVQWIQLGKSVISSQRSEAL